MGFLSTLGKIGAVAAPIAAIPFTGGMSMAALPGILSAGAGALGAIGQVAGGASKGAQQGRQQDTQNLLLQQQLLQQQARDKSGDAFNRGAYQGDDTFRRAQFGQQQQNDMLQRPGLFGKQALMGGLMANLQDVNIDRPNGSTVPTFNVSGGLRPSAMGQDARGAGAEMSRAALMNMLSGGPAPIEMGPQADLGAGYQAPPNLQLPQAGLGEKLLGGIGLGSSLLGGLGAFMGGQQEQAPISTTRDRQASVPSAWALPKSPALQQPMATMDATNMFNKRPYKGLFAPTGGVA